MQQTYAFATLLVGVLWADTGNSQSASDCNSSSNAELTRCLGRLLNGVKIPQETHFCESFEPVHIEQRVGDTILPAGTELARQHDEPTACFRVRNDIDIDGIRYKKQTNLLLDSNGWVMGGTIATSQTINTVTLPAGSSFLLRGQEENTSQHPYAYSSLKAVSYGAPTRIHGVLFPKDTTVWFTLDGVMDHVTPSRTTIINGIPFCGGSVRAKVYLALLYDMPGTDTYEIDCDISFYPNGRIRNGTLAYTTTIQRVALPSGTSLWFYENGKLEDASFPGQFASYQGNPIYHQSAGSWAFVKPPAPLSFYENGHVTSIRPLRRAFLNGILYESGADVKFYPNGRVESGTLGANRMIDGHQLKRGDEVTFDERGHLVSWCRYTCHDNICENRTCHDMNE